MQLRKPKMIVAILLVLTAGIFALTVGTACRTENAAAKPQQEASPQATGKQVPVVLSEARTMTFETRIEVSGTVSAERYALVSARIPGVLDAIYADEGDVVEAGETKLFQTDALKVTKAVAIARHDLTVAECSLKETLAQRDKVLANHRLAQSDVRRYEELLKTNAIAAQVVDQQRAQCQACDADIAHVEALLDLADARLEQARLNLTIAEKDLADSLVTAPISGRVSERLREPGEMAAAGTPVLRIEDLARLEVSVFLPEECYAEIVPGETRAEVRVGEGEVGALAVSYKSPTVNPKLRTFEVKTLIESPPQGVVPGRLCRVAIVTDSRPGVGVPAGAVQTRDGKSVVFTVRDGKAAMVAVEPGGEMAGWREILTGASAGMPIVSMGQTLIEEGTPVVVVTEDGR